MRPIAVKNDLGEKIEIKWDADGNIQVRHSDIDRRHFGLFREFAKRIRQPSVKQGMEAKGLNPSFTESQAMLGRLGGHGYIVIGDKCFDLSVDEVRLILETVKLNGGIVPNRYAS